MENSGLYAAAEGWFSNNSDSDSEQAGALPMFLRGSSSTTLEEEMWSDFLSQGQASACEAEIRADENMHSGSLLAGTNPDTTSSLGLSSKDCPDVLAEMGGIVQRFRDSDSQSTLRLDLTNEVSCSGKTKGVHWPDEMERNEKELKRMRSNFNNPSAAAPNSLQLSGAVQNGAGNLGPPMLDEMISNNSSDRGPQRRNSSLDSSNPLPAVEHAAVVAGGVIQNISATTSSDPETRVPTGLGTDHNHGSETANVLTDAGDGGAALAMSASGAVAQALNSTKLLMRNDDKKEQPAASPNLLSSKVLAPVKNVVSQAKTHQVQFVERNSGGRILPTGTFSVDSSLPHESRWAEQLLLECAIAISSKNVVRTQHLMWVLNDLGCLTGDANQRLAAHGLKSLFCKVTGVGDEAGTDPALTQENGGPKTVHRALLKFHDVNPWHHMVYTVANSVMIDKFQGEERLHVIDIGISQGTQWPTFIETLATRASGPPQMLRLTVVKDEKRADSPQVHAQSQPSTDIMNQLERFAKIMGIKIELRTVVSSLESLTRDKLGIKVGEALAICAQFRLHRLPEAVGMDDSVDGVMPELLSPRDRFLQFLHELQPKVMILSENDTDHLSKDFVTRFRPAVDYFWKFLDSTSFSFHGKQSQERQIIEYEAAKAMINNVACDGVQRIERNESHKGWTVRMERARFVSVLPREEILDNVKALIKKYDANWEYGVDMSCVLLLWKHQPVTFCSVWTPSD